MRTYLIINDREVTNPVVKFLLLTGILLFSFVITLVLLFVVLPLIGIVVTLSVGFVLSLFIALVVTVPVLLLVLSLAGKLMGDTEIRIRK